MQSPTSVLAMPDQRDPFAGRVYAIVAQIPEGRVTTYGMIARQLGMPGAARTVGWAMHHCPSDLPWHRVITANGRPAGDPAGHRVALQWALLSDEGIEPDSRGRTRPRRIDLVRYGWDASQDARDDK